MKKLISHLRFCFTALCAAVLFLMTTSPVPADVIDPGDPPRQSAGGALLPFLLMVIVFVIIIMVLRIRRK